VTEEPLSLHHKELLRGRFQDLHTQVSEYSFANLYLFRSRHRYSVIFDDEIFIQGTACNGDRYSMVTRDVGLIDAGVLERNFARTGTLFPVPEEWLPFFQNPRYSVTYRDEDSDYIIDIGKLSAYGGNKMHDKKNLLNQFMRLYQCEALPLTDDRLGDARTVLEAWQEETGSPAEATDYAACGEAIARYDELILCGGIYYIDKQPAGFIIGEEQGDATFALHFAKAKREYKGIYQFMYNQFAKIMPSKYSVFNFEQDLGLESLRHMKTSYQPLKLLKKYRVTMNDGYCKP
jgi:uncharacterized protein